MYCPRGLGVERTLNEGDFFGIVCKPRECSLEHFIRIAIVETDS